MVRSKREICDRNGCDETATRLLVWDLYTGTTKACAAHARWWKRESMMAVTLTSIETQPYFGKRAMT